MAVHDRGPALAALTVPGLGPVLVDQARALGLRNGRVEFDGRADVVPIFGTPEGLSRVRTAEEVLLLVGDLVARRGAVATAAGLDARRLRSALARWLRLNKGSHDRVRVVVRVRNEGNFRRRDLRDALAARVAAFTGWPADQGSEDGAEVWVLECRPGLFRVGLRLPRLGTRADPRRPFELPGAIRPAVAAAMVHLAGQPEGTLVDPCTGSGTILAEAVRAGWQAVGADTSPGALAAAAINATGRLLRSDVRRQPFRSHKVDVVVTNLPFGVRHAIEGLPVAWYRRALAEAMRVADRAIILAPPSPAFKNALGRTRVEVPARYHLRILGRPASVWVLHNR